MNNVSATSHKGRAKETKKNNGMPTTLIPIMASTAIIPRQTA